MHGIPVSTISQENENKIQLPISGNLSRNQNDSRLLHSNITNNELRTETIHASTEIFKTSSTNLPTTHTVGDMLDGFESGRANLKNSSTTVRTPLSTVESFTHIIVVENYTSTVSPSLTLNKHHGFDMKILGYILIPIGCLMAIVVSYCLVSPVKVYLHSRLLRSYCTYSIGISRFNHNRFRLKRLRFPNRTVFQPFSVEMLFQQFQPTVVFSLVEKVDQPNQLKTVFSQ